jgi:hypothetical protein
VSNARTLARLIPGADPRVVQSAGHLFLFEPRTASDVVARWLDAHRNIGVRGRRRTSFSLGGAALARITAQREARVRRTTADPGSPWVSACAIRR